MRIGQKYSHLHAEEWALVHEKAAYQDILQTLDGLESQAYLSTADHDGSRGHAHFSPHALRKGLCRQFEKLEWRTCPFSYTVPAGDEAVEAVRELPTALHEEHLLHRSDGLHLYFMKEAYIKGKIVVESHWGLDASPIFSPFLTPVALFEEGWTEVGVEIVTTQAMARGLVRGALTFETLVENILRHGRSNPPVPLVIIGVEPE